MSCPTVSKFVYLHNLHGEINSGVNKKIIRQVCAMNHLMTAELALFCKSKESVDDYAAAVFSYSKEKGVEPPAIRWCRTKGSISKLLSSLSSKDFLYVRYPPIPSITIPLLVNRNPKVVLEINGILSKEGGNHASVNLGWRMLEGIFRPWLMRMGDNFVAVTDEILKYHEPRGSRNSTKGIVISNGIDCDGFPPRHNKDVRKRQIDLIGVALVSDWHGYDRVLKGMANYAGDLALRFHIVGNGPEIPSLQRLADELELGDRVIFHGFKTGQDLSTLYEMCDIAVSTLAIHRTGLSEHCCLKSREYCARGIPFIYAGEDADFPNEFKFALRMPLSDEPLDVQLVVDFFCQLSHTSNCAGQMRDYAKNHLDWGIKMAELKKAL